MKSLKDVVSFYVLRNIHFAKFLSLISYGSIFCSGGESDKVLKIQIRILRFVNGVNSRTSCRPIFKELKILLPPCIFMTCCVIFRNIT
jgi:hypothetical protein